MNNMKKKESRMLKRILILSILFLFLLGSVHATEGNAFSEDEKNPSLIAQSPLVYNLSKPIPVISADNKSIMVNNVNAVTMNEFKVEGLKFYLVNSTINASYEISVSPDVVYDKINIMEPQVIGSIELKITANKPVYKVVATQIIPTASGIVNVDITNTVDAQTGVITHSQRTISKNNQLIIEKSNELVVVYNNELTTLKNINEKEIKREKLLVETVKPLVDIEKIQNPVLSKNEKFIVQVKKNNPLPFKKKVIESDNYDFIVVENSDLTSYLGNDYVIKISDAKHLKNFVNYSKDILKAESEEKIRKWELKRNVFDVIEIPQLTKYMKEDKWNVQPGQTSQYQQFVTPTDSEIQKISSLISTPQEAYAIAVNWIWVSDQVLHNKVEKWLLPHEFLTNTPSYTTNPAPGSAVSDCSEQANTLVSLLRAIGIPAEDVRVTLGKVNFGGTIGGHAWVEIKENGKWMILEPTSGPYYDEDNKGVISRSGFSYGYWKYHPYPVLETWVHYNDVYFTDEGKEVAPGWSAGASTATETDLWASFLSEELDTIILIYVAVAIAGIFFVVFIVQTKKRGKND